MMTSLAMRLSQQVSLCGVGLYQEWIAGEGATQRNKRRKPTSGGLEDGFFNVDEMDAFLDEQVSWHHNPRSRLMAWDRMQKRLRRLMKRTRRKTRMKSTTFKMWEASQTRRRFVVYLYSRLYI